MKTKFKIIVLINFFFLLMACQNDKKNDIPFILNKLESSTLKNTDKERILDSINQYLSNCKNDSITRKYYFKVANKYYSIDKYDKFFKTVDKVNKLAIKENDTAHIAKSLYFFGDYYEEKSYLDSAFSYYSQSEKLYSLINDTLNIGKTTLYKAGILLDAGIFTESEIKAVTALRLLSKTKDNRLIYECYNNIAIALKELNNYKKSLEYFDLALRQIDQLEKENYPKEKTVKSRIVCYNNIGRVYQKMKKYQIAINYYNKGLQTKNIKQDYPKLYALLLDNLGYSKMKAGNYKGIEEMFLESLRIRDSLGMELGVASIKIDLGEYFLLKKDTTKGFSYLKEGYLLSKKFKSSPYIIQSLKLLMEYDRKNVRYYTNQYLIIKDSLQEIEQITRNKFARIDYETEQIEHDNKTLSKRNTNITIGSFITIFILGILFAIYRLKSKNKELKHIQEQQSKNEDIYQLLLKQQSISEESRKEERNRIAMELHDGIVNSIFTTRFNLMQLEPGVWDKKQLLVEELQKAENEIRRVSHDLKQNLLFEDKTLPEILANLIELQQNEFNTKFDLSVDKYIDWSTISSDAKINVYRIIQEALQNSNKYSKATRCCVFLMKTSDKTTIRIWDNGIGFDTKKIKKGIGLKNIKERAKTLNGEFKITSSPEKGTTIEIVF